jgi:hypothetical protein
MTENKMTFLDKHMFEFFLFLKEYFRMIGIKNKKVDNKILNLRKKYKICFKILDKDGKVIEEIY